VNLSGILAESLKITLWAFLNTIVCFPKALLMQHFQNIKNENSIFVFGYP